MTHIMKGMVDGKEVEWDIDIKVEPMCICGYTEPHDDCIPQLMKCGCGQCVERLILWGYKKTKGKWKKAS